MRVGYDPAHTTLQAVVARARAAGYNFPGLRDLFPRGSPQLTILWAILGLASLAVVVYSGGQFFAGMWQGLKHRQANMHTLVATGTGVAWLYSTIVLLFPQVVPAMELADVYYPHHGLPLRPGHGHAHEFDHRHRPGRPERGSHPIRRRPTGRLETPGYHPRQDRHHHQG